jgi:hypothetical protein
MMNEVINGSVWLGRGKERIDLNNGYGFGMGSYEISGAVRAGSLITWNKSSKGPKSVMESHKLDIMKIAQFLGLYAV